MTRQRYPSDLTDAQWARIAPLIPPPKPGGHPRTVNIREVVNAIFYLNKTGCQWRALPPHPPHRSTGHTYYRNWGLTGGWARLHNALRRPGRGPAGGGGGPPARRLH